MNHAAQLQTAEKALSSDLSAAFSSALAERFGARFSVAQAVRAHHGRDESSYDPMLPDAVVFARSTEEVAAADASLGGMAAPRASGTNAVRYDTMRSIKHALDPQNIMNPGKIIRWQPAH